MVLWYDDAPAAPRYHGQHRTLLNDTAVLLLEGAGGLGLIKIMAEIYEIWLKGHIDPGWTGYFDGLQLTHQADGTTLLAGPIPDQPALLGLLMRIGSLGLSILIVKNIDYHPQKRD